MANKEQVRFETKNEFIFQELQDAFAELMNNFKKLKMKNKEMKNKFLSYLVQMKNFQKIMILT